ncbi:site-specific recombinase XerD [Oryzihumus leptocrescens]|uniref:Site-specific recombinase XerD n=1 Tax=Oryzihumus leptocrescens TaxID=297536 RepID=A0A542ZEK4_9MICO|nr:site-specific recombinase XerD [Oryzihumus leptocrescens]
MARLPLALGSWGEISVVPLKDAEGQATGYRARTRFRDLDGKVRLVERSGRSQTAARTELKKHLNDRTRLSSEGDLSGMDTFAKAADLWMIKIERMVREGRRSPGTRETYRRQLTAHVLPALGQLRLVEITTPLLDRFVSRLVDQVGPATARTSRTIVSGVLGMAVRQGAIVSNPVRELERVEGKRRRDPRALTEDERREWFAKLRLDQRAVDFDLVDFSLFLLATGLRIGEALAVLWEEVDLETGSINVTSTMIRVTGEGLIRKGTKSVSGQRRLLLPTWAVEMLRQRWLRGARLDMPVMHNLDGGFRDPHNTRTQLRSAAKRICFDWVTPHVFRKTCATILDDAGLTARMIADQLGHSRPSMTQDVYMGRKAPNPMVVRALDEASPDPREAQAAIESDG